MKHLPNQSRHEFQKYWLEKHATLIIKSGVGSYIKRYAQAHTIESSLGDEMRTVRGTMEPYDGVCELWVNVEQMREARLTLEEKNAEAERVQDEKRFIDSSRSISLIARDHIIIERNPGQASATLESQNIKIFYAIRRIPYLSREKFNSYWFDKHSKLIRKHAAKLGLWCYIDGHVMEDPIVTEMKALRNVKFIPFDGYAEAWVDLKQLTMVSSTSEGKRIWAEIVEDEGKFIDFSHSSIWMAKEHVIYEDREFIFQ